MSTFGGLTTAYSGLSAARAALETTGQNVANVNTVIQNPNDDTASTAPVNE